MTGVVAVFVCLRQDLFICEMNNSRLSVWLVVSKGVTQSINHGLAHGVKMESGTRIEIVASTKFCISP